MQKKKIAFLSQISYCGIKYTGMPGLKFIIIIIFVSIVTIKSITMPDTD